MKSEALVVSAPHKIALRAISVPAPGPRHALVAVNYSCISPGTESRVLAGTQVNMPNFPVVPGYSASGVVERVGEGSCWQAGDPVFLSGAPSDGLAVCWGAHQRHVVVADAALTAIPSGLDLRLASAAKLAAIAEHGRRLAGITAGERVAVLGLGPIGFFAALCARAEDADVFVSDLQTERAGRAERMGFRLLPAGGEAPAGGFDVVVDATGAPSALAVSVRLLREKPWDNDDHPVTRLVIQGSYAAPPPLPYDDLFWKEPVIFIPRDNQRADVERVLAMMASGRLPALDLLEDLGPPSQASEAYQSLANGGVVTGYFSWV